MWTVCQKTGCCREMAVSGRLTVLTDPLGGSSLLDYINYNCKINQIKLFTNYSVELGLTESNYSKTDKSLCTLFLKKFLESLKNVL